MPNEDLVSYVLASLRAAHGFTQEELADRTGFDQAQISRWETGREVPSVAVLNALLTCLKTTPAEFFKLQSLLLRIIERPDSFSEGVQESLERHDRYEADDLPLGRSSEQVAEARAGGGARSFADDGPSSHHSVPRRPASVTMIEGIAQAIRDRVDRGSADREAGAAGEEQEVGPLDREVDVLAKETARLVESHVRLFYRALAGPAGPGEPDD